LRENVDDFRKTVAEIDNLSEETVKTWKGILTLILTRLGELTRISTKLNIVVEFLESQQKERKC